MRYLKRKIRKKFEGFIIFFVFMGLGIYEVVWMFFFGMLGFRCFFVFGCVRIGVVWLVVKSIVKEIFVFGFWEV